MARHPGLMRRKARWYLRAKIPVEPISMRGRSNSADAETWARINGEVPKLVLDWFRAAEHRASHDDFKLTGDLLYQP